MRGGVMRVGVTHVDPWVKLEGGEPGGVEVELLERFARTLGARVEWKLQDVVVAVVRDLEGAPPEVIVSSSHAAV